MTIYQEGIHDILLQNKSNLHNTSGAKKLKKNKML